MRCPFCAHEDSQVKDSRPTEDGAAIRRRRQCEDCGARFTTFERIQLRELTVVKSEDRREPFDRAKLERSIAIACRKRPVPRRADRAARLLDPAPDRDQRRERDRPRRRIGEMVMEGLKALDPVAYIRFATSIRISAKPRISRISPGAVSEAATQRVTARLRRDRPRPSAARREYRQGGAGDAQFRADRPAAGRAARRLAQPGGGAGGLGRGCGARTGAGLRQRRRGGRRLPVRLRDHGAQARAGRAGRLARGGGAARSARNARRRRRSCSAPSGRGWRPTRSRSPARSSPCRSIPSSARSTSPRR